jgi:membrane protease YdiL (CAAX protease family)
LRLLQSHTYLILELITIFIGLPTLIYYWSPHPLLPLLWLLAIVCGTLLINDKTFNRSSLWVLNPVVPYKTLLLQAIVVFIISALIIYLIEPLLLFSLIKTNPLLWVLVMIFYPLLSVYPQELIYRSFYFHRYDNLIKNHSLAILLNAILFGYMHIIFHNWVAVILTFFGGLFFANLYVRSRSILFVSIVHAVYGSMIFTLGLGQYFYHGSITAITEAFKF